MSKVYKTTVTLKFRDGDPAQIMYFANAFSFSHDAFESFIIEAGYTWKEWFKTKELMIPIRHTEADFLGPFYPGETYEIAVTVASFRETSFKMKYVFSSPRGVHAQVTMVHSVLDAKTLKKIPIPEIMKKRLSPYLEKSS